jgi:hypothetical protein
MVLLHKVNFPFRKHEKEREKEGEENEEAQNVPGSVLQFNLFVVCPVVLTQKGIY